MALVSFPRNDLRERDAGLAARVEAEIDAALARTDGTFTCRVEACDAPGGGLDAVVVLIEGPGTAFEWSLAPPLAPGDVRRAAEGALLGRRSLEERRHSGRSHLDRRRS